MGNILIAVKAAKANQNAFTDECPLSKPTWKEQNKIELMKSYGSVDHSQSADDRAPLTPKGGKGL